MNPKAGQLGAWDTVAVDPSGLDAPGQRSSAYDLALFGRAVMLPAYRQVATTKRYTFPGATDRNGKVFPPFEIQNHNTLLQNYRERSASRTVHDGSPEHLHRRRHPERPDPAHHPDGRHGHAELGPPGRAAGLGVRQRAAAAFGRDARGARRRSAARARRRRPRPRP